MAGWYVCFISESYLTCYFNLKFILWVNPEDVTAERETNVLLFLLRIIPSLPILDNHLRLPKDSLHQEEDLILPRLRVDNNLILEAAVEKKEVWLVDLIMNHQDNQENAITNVGNKEKEACHIILVNSSQRNRPTSRPNFVLFLIR